MNPPQLDARTRADLIARIKELAPYYTPEWRFTPEDPDPGTALFLLFADMYEENIRRLNRVPFKHFVAFLNLFDVSLLPAHPAATYVAFSLSEGTKEPVLLGAGTRINATDPDGDIPFETESTVLLTPARWRAAFLSSRTHDRIVRIPQRLLTDAAHGKTEPVPLFALHGTDNLQSHALFLAHDPLFTVYGTAVIEVELGHSARRFDETGICGALSDPALAEWLYASEDGWRPFDRVETRGGRIVLRKSTPGEMAERDVNGSVRRWIQCRLVPHSAGAKSLAGSGLALDRIRLKTDYADDRGCGGLEPDRMFYNDIEADRNGFYPFGDQFVPYGCFYVASREALTKKDGRIRLDFTLKAIENRFLDEPEQQVNWKPIMKKSQFEKKEPPRASIAQVAWEYWNGGAWVRLDAGKDAEALFDLPGTEEVAKRVEFRCPTDLEPVHVNGHENYWIRARILQIENVYAPFPVYLSPWLERVRMSYGFGDRAYPPQRCLTLNHTVYEDRTPHSRSETGGFEPFVALDAPHPTLHIAFDAPPVRGPISIYVSARPRQSTGESAPWLDWEYLRYAAETGAGPEWAPLKVADGTNGLTESGTLQFAGPPDFAERMLFGCRGYWIRAVNRDDRYDDLSGSGDLPMLNGLFLNTVRAVQQVAAPAEYPERSERDEGVVYPLAGRNVVSEEIWVDETERVSEEELAAFDEQADPFYEAVRDSDGKLRRVWVRWTEKAHFAESSAKDRHYTLDRASGTLRFGDGIHGMEPPQDGMENVKAVYRVTLGKRGNTAAGTIVQLQNSIAFVEGATNVEPAAGGCDPETLESAVRRGPQMLKHRGRAVTAEDFEWLAREAYPNIAKVKCMANVNGRMEPEAGCMTLVALPKEGREGLPAFTELKKRVEAYLIERAPSLAAWPENIRAVPPAFLEISVIALVAVERFEDVLPAELEAIRKLESFLDPLTGNFDGKGWEIGQTIHPSVFYALLKTVRSIAFVDKLYMTAYMAEDDRRIELDGNRPLHVPHGVIVSGKHKVSVRTI